MNPKWSTPCTRPVALWIDTRLPIKCGATPTRRFLNDWFCAFHARVIPTPQLPLDSARNGTARHS